MNRSDTASLTHSREKGREEKSEEQPEQNDLNQSGDGGSGARWVSLGIYTQFLMKLIKGLVFPKLLSPKLYGLYASLGVIQRYGTYTDLGVKRQLAKQLPGDWNEGKEQYQETLALGISWVALSTGIAGILVSLGAFVMDGPNAWFYRIALPIAGLVLVSRQIRMLFNVALVALERFWTSTMGMLIVFAGGAGVGITLLLAFGVLGLVASLVIVESVAVAFYASKIEWPGFATIRWDTVKPLIQGGLILLVLKSSELVLSTIDQLFLLRFFPKDEFGIYSLGLFVSSTALSVSGIYLTVIHPKMMSLVDEGRNEEAHRLMDKALVAYYFSLSVALPVGYVLLATVVPIYLPEYASGIDLYILITGMALFRGPILLFQPHFIAHDQEKTIVKYYVYCIILSISLDSLVVYFLSSIELIALTSVIAYFILSSILFFVFDIVGKYSIKESKYFLLLTCSTSTAFFLAYQKNYQEISLHLGIDKLFALSGLLFFSLLALGIISIFYYEELKRSIFYFWA